MLVVELNLIWFSIVWVTFFAMTLQLLPGVSDLRIFQKIGTSRPSYGIGDFLRAMHDTNDFKDQ